ncbi:MAG: biotin/lipoate A/B protein ligase family protein [Thermoguttaceae bacterium]|jgi:lipoate-protein ligase A|nr:biotin/lipoate A/B protein ligase family protein [Thermoguttaceae bacterium]
MVHVLIDPPLSGPWNMAVDEALLDDTAESGRTYWRFYQWQEPTLSLGYFQPYDDDARRYRQRGLTMVRRLTGGGAILHDHELTYSVILPRDHALARNRDDLYQVVHRSLVAVLEQWRLEPQLFVAGAARPASEPFLCFERRAPGDVLAGRAKVAGSAQRRRRGAVLQHGSVLLGVSDAARHLPGVGELADCSVGPDEFARRWLPNLSESFGGQWQPSSLSESVRSRAADLLAGKYMTESWLRDRRAPQ